MWQHKWAIWSGCLGATASCVGKIAFTDNPMSPLLALKEKFCEVRLTSDVDAAVLNKIYWVLGDLMIKYNINLMIYWRVFRLQIEEYVLQFHIFEVDWCRALLLGPRIGCFVLMLIVNAYMVASFLKGMKVSGSVVGTALSSGANFVVSALYGYVIWEERFSQFWWIGFATVIAGVALLSTTVVSDSDEKGNAPDKTKRAPITITVYERGGSQNEEFVAKKLPLQDYINAATTTKTPATASPSQVSLAPSKILGPSRSLLNRRKQMTTPFVDRFFLNQCPLCQQPLFDDKTGLSSNALANLSPYCFSVYHAKCLIQHCTQMKKSKMEALCVVTNKPINMWTRTKQSASLAAFWIGRVEKIGKRLGPAKDDQGRPRPLSMDIIRQKLHEDPTLTEEQKQYIDDDPTGLNKGLASCMTWGGSVDYNDCAKGHSDWKRFLVTEGVWQYDARRDEIWIHAWGLHPKKRCDYCQSSLPLPFLCDETKGSCETLAYCSQHCQKGGFKRHKLTRKLWQEKGPPSAYYGR